MKNYGTFVYTEDQSREVQNALALVGIDCVNDDRLPFTTGGMFIIFGAKDGYFFKRNPSAIFNMQRNTASQTNPSDLFFVSAEDIIADPFQLDGAKKPEKQITVNGKEYSESTIMSALRQYVE